MRIAKNPEILDGAMRLFYKKGYIVTLMSAIAKEIHVLRSYVIEFIRYSHIGDVMIYTIKELVRMLKRRLNLQFGDFQPQGIID